MTIEIRREHHEFLCDWGVFRNAECATRYPIQHLILITPDVFKRLLLCGPEENTCGEGTLAASTQDGHMFAHLDWDGKHWTWECFNAHWWDHATLLSW
jgi:hypothetical protein